MGKSEYPSWAVIHGATISRRKGESARSGARVESYHLLEGTHEFYFSPQEWPNSIAFQVTSIEFNRRENLFSSSSLLAAE
jgi:hypothetical protein